MTASSTAEPPSDTAGDRSAAPRGSEGAAAPEPPKLRRRPMLIALSVLLTAVGALLGAWLLTGLSGTKSYIAVREDIQRGDVIEESDLVRTQLRADGALTPLVWDEKQFVVGQYAKVDMAAGSVVTNESVASQVVPPGGKTVVGLALVPGQSVSGDLKTGDPVRAIIVPPDSEEGSEPEKVSGSIANVKMSSDGTTKLVDVIVSADDAPMVAAAGARQEVSVVLDSTNKGGGDDSATDEAGDESSGDDGSGTESPTGTQTSPTTSPGS